MKENMVAVAVGFNFGLVPRDEVLEIKVKPAGTVRFEDENFNLFKAETYEDSRIIDALLDKYGEFPIKDYKVEPVIMSGVIEMEIPRFNKEKDVLSFGAYTFKCDGKEIPVDFSGTRWDIKQNGDHLTISFQTGDTPLLTDFFLDDCYIDAYQEAGLRYNDITAEFLSKAESIFEFMVTAELDGEEYYPEEIHEMGKFQIKSLNFSNLENTYELNPKAIDEFNRSLDAFKENRIWITIYKDILGIDDWDNLTSICVPKDWLIEKLKEEGEEDLNEWLMEYTADGTDSIARDALAENKVLEYTRADLKELQKLKESENMLYHATFGAYIPDIMEKGLVPDAHSNWDKKENGFVYLTNDIDAAIEFCECAEDVPDEVYHSGIYCFGVNRLLLDEAALISDPNIDLDMDSDMKCYAYKGEIPYQWLRPMNELPEIGQNILPVKNSLNDKIAGAQARLENNLDKTSVKNIEKEL